jgi:hypothetical protein
VSFVKTRARTAPLHTPAPLVARLNLAARYLVSALSGRNRTLTSRWSRRAIRQRRRPRPSAVRTNMKSSGSLSSLASVIRAPVSDRSKTMQCNGRVPPPQSIRAGRCSCSFRRRSGMNSKKHRGEQQHRNESSNGYGISPIAHHRSPHRSQPPPSYPFSLHRHAPFVVTV